MTAATRNERFYNFWVVVRPSKELEGQWIAHCLELDIVTQGNSIRHVFEMIEEAVSMAVIDDLADQIEPHSRNSAPKEYWDELWENIKRGESIELVELMKSDDSTISFVAAQLVTRVEMQVKELPREVPALWRLRRDHGRDHEHAALHA